MIPQPELSSEWAWFARRCPTCTWPDGFHDREIHDKFTVDPKLIKEKDWHKSR